MAKEADGTAVKDRPDDTVALSELQAKLDESEARLTERDGELEHIKQIQSGSDTKVAELQTVIDEMRKAQMTDEDRDKAERKQIKDEIEVLKTDLADERNDKAALTLLTEAGLSPALLPLVKNAPDIPDAIKTLSDTQARAKGDGAKEFTAKNGRVVDDGEKTPPITRDRLMAASPQQVLRWRQDPVKAAAIDRIARGE